MNYRLIIIENSLQDKRILEPFQVLSETRFAPGTDRESRLLKVVIPQEQLARLSIFLSTILSPSFYAHLYAEDPTDDMLIVIFRGKLFSSSKSDPKEAIQYGIEHEISKEEMDISPRNISDETW